MKLHHQMLPCSRSKQFHSALYPFCWGDWEQKVQSLLPKSTGRKRDEAIKHPSFLLLVICSLKMPSGQILHGSGFCTLQEDEARWERVEQRDDFWPVLSWNACCTSSTIKHQLFKSQEWRDCSSSRAWMNTYSRQDLWASTSLQDCPWRVRRDPTVLRPLAAGSVSVPGTCLVTQQMCSHLGRCANGTESLSLPGRCSEMFLDGSAPTRANLPSLVCSLWEWRPTLTPKRCL